MSSNQLASLKPLRIVLKRLNSDDVADIKSKLCKSCKVDNEINRSRGCKIVKKKVNKNSKRKSNDTTSKKCRDLIEVNNINCDPIKNSKETYIPIIKTPYLTEYLSDDDDIVEIREEPKISLGKILNNIKLEKIDGNPLLKRSDKVANIIEKNVFRKIEIEDKCLPSTSADGMNREQNQTTSRKYCYSSDEDGDVTNVNKKLNRSENIDTSLDKNVLNTIEILQRVDGSIHEPPRTLKVLLERLNDEENSLDEGEVKPKSPEVSEIKHLGLKEDEEEVEVSKNALTKKDEISHTITTEICVLHQTYFNDKVKNLINSLCTILKSIFSDLKMKSDLHSILKTYSKKFVDTFHLIIHKFKNEHKSKMIPFVYLYLIKNFEHVGKPDWLWKCIYRMLKMENSLNDFISNQTTWEDVISEVSIYESLLERLMDVKKPEPNEEAEHSEQQISDDEIKILGTESLLEDLMDVKIPEPNEEAEHSEQQISDDEIKILGTESLLERLMDVKIPEPNEETEHSEQQMSADENKILETNMAKENSSDFDNSECVYCWNSQNLTEAMPSCEDESCSKKKELACFYCRDPVTCHDLCQITEDQKIQIEIDEMSIDLQVACQQHKIIIQSGVSFEELNCDIPNDFGCCLTRCKNTAVNICVCKTKAYCSKYCQEEDWHDVHNRTCPRQTTSDLIL